MRIDRLLMLNNRPMDRTRSATRQGWQSDGHGQSPQAKSSGIAPMPPSTNRLDREHQEALAGTHRVPFDAVRLVVRGRQQSPSRHWSRSHCKALCGPPENSESAAPIAGRRPRHPNRPVRLLGQSSRNRHSYRGPLGKSPNQESDGSYLGALDRGETIPESPILGGDSFLCCEVVTRGHRSSPPRHADWLALVFVSNEIALHRAKLYCGAPEEIRKESTFVSSPVSFLDYSRELRTNCI